MPTLLLIFIRPQEKVFVIFLPEDLYLLRRNKNIKLTFVIVGTYLLDDQILRTGSMKEMQSKGLQSLSTTGVGKSLTWQICRCGFTSCPWSVLLFNNSGHLCPSAFKIRRKHKGWIPESEFQFKKNFSSSKWQNLRTIAHNYPGEGNAIRGREMKWQRQGRKGPQGTGLLQARAARGTGASGSPRQPHCLRKPGTHFP